MDTCIPVVPDTQARLMILALTSAETVYTVQEGPSNHDKLHVIREEFAVPQADVFSPFPYDDIYVKGSPESLRAAYYMCDLRTQAFDRLLAEHIGDATDHLRRRFANVVWKIKFREKINMHNITVNNREGKALH